jgi:hypothetical protein
MLPHRSRRRVTVLLVDRLNLLAAARYGTAVCTPVRKIRDKASHRNRAGELACLGSVGRANL